MHIKLFLADRDIECATELGEDTNHLGNGNVFVGHGDLLVEASWKQIASPIRKYSLDPPGANAWAAVSCANNLPVTTEGIT